MQTLKTIIIAEAGVNHNGKVNLALKLIDKAAEAGADYIKFQHTEPELIAPKTSMAKYQIKNTKKNESQRSMVKKFHLDWEKTYPLLLKRCKRKKIKFLTSVFSKNAFLKIKKFNLDYIKIPSGEIVNTPLLKEISKVNKKTIVSTGMANINEISRALNILCKRFSKKRVFLLHCISDYPTDYSDINLNTLNFLKKKFRVNVGISDHSLGIEVPIASIPFGVKIIEKHFTLSKKMKGPDHSISLDPNELKNMIKSIRNIENALGLEKKIITKKEMHTKKIVRQSVHAKKNINKGEKFTIENIILMRPGDGAKPEMFQKILSKKSKKDYKIFDPILT
tara:strand:+ start:2382 stop:3389 length:1008 start_codon:yes stop_codon:yes gene_type:complete